MYLFIDEANYCLAKIKITAYGNLIVMLVIWLVRDYSRKFCFSNAKV